METTSPITPPLRVTEVLRLAGLRDGMPFMSDEDRKWCFARGTMIHKATVLIDRGELDWTALDERIVPFCRGYETFIKDIAPKVLLCEQAVGASGWVGHLDRVYEIGRVRVVCDIKTNECDKATATQTMAYAVGLGWKVRRMGLALRDNGTYKATWYEDDAGDLAGWRGALAVARWKLRNGVK